MDARGPFQVFLDASAWKEPADFYRVLFLQIGAPDWHGENLAALRDSMVTGDINALPPPYEIELTGMHTLSTEMRDLLRGFAEVIEDGRAEGVPNVLRCKPPL